MGSNSTARSARAGRNDDQCSDSSQGLRDSSTAGDGPSEGGSAVCAAVAYGKSTVRITTNGQLERVIPWNVQSKHQRGTAGVRRAARPSERAHLADSVVPDRKSRGVSTARTRGGRPRDAVRGVAAHQADRAGPDHRRHGGGDWRRDRAGGRGRKERGGDRRRRTEGRRGAPRGGGGRPHPRDGRVERRRAEALAPAGARSGNGA